jgi:hypothetical protein
LATIHGKAPKKIFYGHGLFPHLIFSLALFVWAIINVSTEMALTKVSNNFYLAKSNGEFSTL